MSRIIFLICLLMTSSVYAAIDVYNFESPAQEQRFQNLINELRCPKCQNQNLSGSDAAVARDLKRRVYELMQEGKSDAEINAYFVERYGDFISYNPPLRASTFFLWFGPLVLIALVLVTVFYKKRQYPAATTSLSDTEQKKIQEILAQSQRDDVR